MRSKLAVACLTLVAGLAAAPASAQYYHPGPGYYQPVQPQIYLPPNKARRNIEKLHRKQAEFYQRYGYPAPPRGRMQPQYRPHGYAQPYGYAPPPRAYRRPPPQYYYYD